MYQGVKFMGMRRSQIAAYAGRGYIGGDLPATADPDEPDGRAKILNVPSRVRVMAYDRSTMRCLGQAISQPNGSWRIEHVREDIAYVVIGFDDRGQVNAAIQDWIRPEPMA